MLSRMRPETQLEDLKSKRPPYTRPDTFLNRVYAYTHTRIETPGCSIFWHYIAWPVSEITRLITRSKIIGNAPTEDAALLVANHISGMDPPNVQLTVVTRALRTFAQVSKRKLVDPTVEESEEVENRRTQKSIQHGKYENFNPIKKVILQTQAFLLRQFGPIPMDPGGSDAKELFSRVAEEFRHGRIVSMFYQGTRRPAMDLLDAKEGVAFLVTTYLPAQRLDVPIYPMGITGAEIRIGSPFQISDIPLEKGEKRRDTVMNYIIDRVAELVTNPSLKPAWLMHKLWGLSKEELRIVYDRDADMDSARRILESLDYFTENKISHEEAILALEQMDRPDLFGDPKVDRNLLESYKEMEAKADVLGNLLRKNEGYKCRLPVFSVAVRWLFRHIVTDVGIEGIENLHKALDLTKTIAEEINKSEVAVAEGEPTNKKAAKKKLFFTPRHEADADHEVSRFLLERRGLRELCDRSVFIGGAKMIKRWYIRMIARAEEVVYIATPDDVKQADTLMARKNEFGDQEDPNSALTIDRIDRTFRKVNQQAKDKVRSAVQADKAIIVYPEAGRSYDGFMKKAPGQIAAYFPRDGSVVVVPYRLYGAKDVNPPHKFPNFWGLIWPSKRVPVSMKIGEPYLSSEIWEWMMDKKRREKEAGRDGKDINPNPADWIMINLANVDPTNIRPEELRYYRSEMTHFKPERNRIPEV